MKSSTSTITTASANSLPGVLFWMFGSSCSGKTYTLERLRGRDAGLVVCDFDELGAAEHATLAWRRRTNERWLRRALELDGKGLDLLVAGQSPLGELLVAPSAPGV